MRYCSISFEILPIDFPGLRILSGYPVQFRFLHRIDMQTANFYGNIEIWTTKRVSVCEAPQHSLTKSDKTSRPKAYATEERSL